MRLRCKMRKAFCVPTLNFDLERSSCPTNSAVAERTEKPDTQTPDPQTPSNDLTLAIDNCVSQPLNCPTSNLTYCIKPFRITAICKFLISLPAQQ